MIDGLITNRQISKFVLSLLGTKSLQVFFTPACHQSSLHSPPLKKEKINGNLQLSSIQDDCGHTRPLVLLFGWLLAKQRHLDKYANLYHSKGFDVLSLQMQPQQVLIPSGAKKTVSSIVDILSDTSMSQRPLLHHGFSVGGYMYGEFLVKILSDPERHASICNRMIGQIFDSPVDFKGIPIGFSSALTKNKLLRGSLRMFLQGYLNAMHKPVTSHYIKASEFFRRNDMRLPTLMLYSKADPIGTADRIEEVMNIWQEDGMSVTGRCWESSPHVSHFHRHPDEYVEAVLTFLKSVGLHDQKKEEAVKKAQAI